MSYHASVRGMVALIEIRVGCAPTVRHGTVDKETSVAVTGQKLAMPRYCAHRTASQDLKLRTCNSGTGPLKHCVVMFSCGDLTAVSSSLTSGYNNADGSR